MAVQVASEFDEVRGRHTQGSTCAVINLGNPGGFTGRSGSGFGFLGARVPPFVHGDENVSGVVYSDESGRFIMVRRDRASE
ncbi:hypothetical protein C474_20256 [Halogeometricum pallidum JCM 14848]|uniref:Uncharacterized protein n=1 Tax=Halogeometricum pallidum JCM 14848 TaxID=1227487 RepID=M0CS40_HALPD|nr:hypothetical protein C474_20256 [Halogeometricum pallidum JCM 14848]